MVNVIIKLVVPAAFFDGYLSGRVRKFFIK